MSISALFPNQSIKKSHNAFYILYKIYLKLLNKTHTQKKKLFIKVYFAIIKVDLIEQCKSNYLKFRHLTV